MQNLFILLGSILTSTLLYLYLHKKTKISLVYLLLDNVAVIFLTLGILFLLNPLLPKILLFILVPVLVTSIAFMLTMIRFWRTPSRKVKATLNELISPADGNIIYIKEIPAGDIPISVKNGLEAKLSELSGTDLLNNPSWLIGINMTPFDVHKNCAPVSGLIVLNKHINGEFLSLKNPQAILKNERNTLVIKTEEDEYFGIIQTASKLVRRIDTYVKENEKIEKGEWFGMIRFGSQVDLIIPKNYQPNVVIGQQVYAVKSILAKK